MENNNSTNAVIRIRNRKFDIHEYGQRIPMRKRGHYSEFEKRSRDGKSKKSHSWAKAYKTRRSAIKRGELGSVARFGVYGCSSYFW